MSAEHVEGAIGLVALLLLAWAASVVFGGAM